MVELVRHKVRFGELSVGPLLHYATFFDLVILATEELSYELGYTVEEIVAGGGVPYAPVAIHADIRRYPQYADTVVVEVEPISIGENHVQLGYRFSRAADSVEFGTASMVQVTITPEGRAEPVSDEVRAKLEAMGTADREPVEIEPRSLRGEGPSFSRRVVFRTPLVEAANLGYFEDYARELSITVEEFLEAQGRSLGDLSGETYPFVPFVWDFTLEDSIRFEDDILIAGEVLGSTADRVDIAYEMRRATTDEVCIRADVGYGCFDANGERVAFADEALSVVTGK